MRLRMGAVYADSTAAWREQRSITGNRGTPLASVFSRHA